MASSHIQKAKKILVNLKMYLKIYSFKRLLGEYFAKRYPNIRSIFYNVV